MGFDTTADFMPLVWLLVGTVAIALSPFLIAKIITRTKRKKPPKYPQATKPFRKILNDKN